MSTNTGQKLGSEDTWNNVSEYLEPLGIFPSSFTSCVRSLIHNQATNEANNTSGVNPGCRSLLLRLMQSPTLTSMMYYGTRTFKEDEIPAQQQVTADQLLALHTPMEIAAMLSVIYLYRSLRKRCNHEEWMKYQRTIVSAVEMGGHLGDMIPQIGFARGLIAGAFPHLGLCAMMIGNLKAFKDYRKKLRAAQRVIDLNLEAELFECTSVQVASRMLQHFGFGKELVKDFYFGISETGDEKAMQDGVLAFAVANNWVRSLLETGTPPESRWGDEFVVSGEKLDRHLPDVKSILNEGSRFEWLEKGKEHLAERVVLKPTDAVAAEPEVEEDPHTLAGEARERYDDLPDEIKSQLAFEEFEELSSNIQDLLV